MENYVKDKIVEEYWSRERIPIPNLPWDLLWMQVKAGSKMIKLLAHAMPVFEEGGRNMVWSASGAAIGKAISCAEIVKRRHKNGLHQITKICYRKVEEFWKPLLDELDPLVVVREVPTIHILISKDPLNSSEPGYQPPHNANVFWKSDKPLDSGEQSGKPSGKPSWKPSGKKAKKGQGYVMHPSEFAALGLRSNRVPRSRKHGSMGDQETGESGARASSSGTASGKKPKEQDKTI